MMNQPETRLIVPHWPNWHVMYVEPRAGHILYLEFNDGRRGLFDMKPYLNKGVFVRLKDLTLFEQVWVDYCTIDWPGDIDIAPETLHYRCEPFVSGSDKRIDSRLPDYWIMDVKAMPDHRLQLEFNDRNVGVFDVKPLLDDERHSVLKDPEVFAQVGAQCGMAIWPDITSMSPGYLYKHCQFVAT